LQTHHYLRIQDQHADSALGIDDGRATGSYQQPIQGQELHAAGFQLQAPMDPTSRPEDSEREGPGVARNPRHSVATKSAPYYGALEFA
jgi:hypothetical protein